MAYFGIKRTLLPNQIEEREREKSKTSKESKATKPVPLATYIDLLLQNVETQNKRILAPSAIPAITKPFHTWQIVQKHDKKPQKPRKPNQFSYQDKNGASHPNNLTAGRHSNATSPPRSTNAEHQIAATY
jgi:hypothetical protein